MSFVCMLDKARWVRVASKAEEVHEDWEEVPISGEIWTCRAQ